MSHAATDPRILLWNVTESNPQPVTKCANLGNRTGYGPGLRSANFKIRVTIPCRRCGGLFYRSIFSREHCIPGIDRHEFVPGDDCC